MTGRILYVDSDLTHRRRIRPELSEHASRMASLLAEEYGADNVDSYYNLDERITRMAREKADSGEPYRALITHVPHELGKVTSGMTSRIAFLAAYERSLGLLEALKDRNPGLFILAYTGATSVPRSVMESVLVGEGPIDALVPKSSSAEIESDFENIKDALSGVVG